MKKIGGDIFRVLDEGEPSRPAVLLSNSLGTDLTLWDAQMPMLLERFRVVRYDSRGHGGSDVREGAYSIAQLGQDALAILDSLGIDKAHFVGISLGGAVGQWVLANAPERIGRAVLANTAARFGTPDLWNTRIQAVLAGGMAALAAATMERWFSADFRTRAPERVAAVEQVFRATSPKGYAACCAALRDMDLRQSLYGIEQPVLIVTGRDDPVTSEADIALLTGTIRNATHVSLDCKHISNIEAEVAFNTAVVAFLTAKAAARPKSPRKSPAAARHSASNGVRAVRGATPKAASKRAPAKTAPARPKATNPAEDKPTAGRRRPVTKSTAARTRSAATKKAATKKAATRTPAKKAATRRVTTTPAARGTIKKAPSKLKPIKTATKKTPTKKPAAKTIQSARRAPTKKPRRPTGRRKP